MAMPWFALREHLPRGHIECREQRRRAMPHVAVGDAFDIPQAQQQEWLRALQRLKLAPFINTRHQRVVRRIEIQAHDIPHFVDEERIGGKGKSGGAMRLHAQQREVPLHRALADPRFLRDAPRTPMGTPIQGLRF